MTRTLDHQEDPCRTTGPWPPSEPTEVHLPQRRRPARRRPPGRGTAPAGRRRLGRPRRLPRRHGAAGPARWSAAALAEPAARRPLDLGGARSSSSTSPRPSRRTPSTAWCRGSPGPCSPRRVDARRSARSSRRGRAIPSAWPPPSTTRLRPDRLDGDGAGPQPRARSPPRSGPACTPTCTSGPTRTAASAAPSSPSPPARRLDVDGGLPTGGTPPVPRGRRPDRAPRLRRPADRSGAGRRRLGPRASARPARASSCSPSTARWPWLQIYTGDQLPEGQRRRSLAVEPMTCPPNALADGADLVVLEPGERVVRHAGRWLDGVR